MVGNAKLLIKIAQEEKKRITFVHTKNILKNVMILKME